MRAKKFEIGFLLFLLSLFLLSCASGKKTTREEPSRGEAGVYDESFDPLKLQDEDIVFKEEGKTSRDEVVSTPRDIQQPTQENRLVDGFRIQLFATKDIESATIAKKEAEFVFTEDSLDVYVEFESPYYKLRIGDFKNRDDAVAFREIAREKGYTSSWIVKTKVWSNPSLSNENKFQ